MKIFNDLGAEIEELWREENYNEAHLPAIAADALRRADIPSKATVWEILEWGLGLTELPRQRDIGSNFGDPPITIYSGLRFHVDVYFWFEGTTSIHQHNFCGAFQVMHGSSIHSWYEFVCEKKINTFTEIGTMSLKLCELLNVGDVQEIQGGRKYIHSLFHLDHPSATIVVRTDRSPIEPPQYNYVKPKLAIDPFFEQDTVTKKTQLAAALIRAKVPEADRMIHAWLETCDFQTTYNLLVNLRHLLQSNQLDKMFSLSEPGSRFEEYLKVAEKKHGEDVEVIRAAFAHQDLLGEVMQKRNFVTEPEHRFFFALLLNVEGRDQIFSLIKQRFPDAEPVEKVIDWVYDLSNTRIVGAENANALGIPDFGDIDLFVFEKVLAGQTGATIEEALVAEYGESAADKVSTVAEKEIRIREAVMFKPLLS